MLPNLDAPLRPSLSDVKDEDGIWRWYMEGKNEVWEKKGGKKMSVRPRNHLKERERCDNADFCMCVKFVHMCVP